MQENQTDGPSLIKLGKLANSKKFNELAELWLMALDNTEYTWRELLPIAGQVGRQGAPDKAASLMETLLDWVQEHNDAQTSLEAIRKAAMQLPSGNVLRPTLVKLYIECFGDFDALPDLLDLIVSADADLAKASTLVDLYIQLQPGAYAVDRAFLVPGLVESVVAETGLLSVRFDDRRAEYDLASATKLSPRGSDFFPAIMLYNPERLKTMADEDAVGFVKLALAANRENRLTYRELKGHVAGLLGEKGWKSWWQEAKVALKRDPIMGMSSGSQPVFRILRQADRYEDRLRREFDHTKDPEQKLLKVMNYLDELSREEKQSAAAGGTDEELLKHFGNGAAKVAVSVLKETPSLALAGLALHAEIAGRGADVARPNPKAAAQVLSKLQEADELAGLPEALQQRVLVYVRQTVPEKWGMVWSAVLLRSGKRMCDMITRGLIEGKKTTELEAALLQALARPTSSPELLNWLWRTRHASSAAARFLATLDGVPVNRIADAMFVLLDSVGKLYAMSMEEKHLKLLESARAALVTQNSRPLLSIIEDADRREAIRLKGILEKNHGLSPAQRTQLLGYLRSHYADIFVEATREWEDPNIIYTTEDGLRKTQNALNFIIETEIPEVAKQIGEAASFGDLSENAEFTAALEKRDQLASRATRMESELAMAQVINHDMAGGEFVNAGTRVTARLVATGAEEVYTFLGPWDTDTEKLVLNYQAPLAMAFMGAKVGDQVAFGEDSDRREWEILAIEPAV